MSETVLRVVHVVPRKPVIDGVGPYQATLLQHFARLAEHYAGTAEIEAKTFREILFAPAGRWNVIHFQFPLRAWRRNLAIGLWYVLLRLRHPRSAIVTTAHEWSSLNPLRRFLLTPCLLLSDVLICPTGDVAAAVDPVVQRLTGHKAKIERISIAPNLDIPETLPPPRSPHPLTVGHFGFLYEPKLPMKLAEVLRALKAMRPEIRIRLVGTFNANCQALCRQFDAEIERSGLTGNIDHQGYADDKRSIELLSGCDVFLGFHARGFTDRNGSMLTCLFLDRPVVTSSYKGTEPLPQWLQDFIREGRLVFVENTDSPDVIARVVIAAAERVLPDISLTPDGLWGEIVAAHIRCYEKLATI